MPTITLRHQQTTEPGFVATLSIDGQTQSSVTVQDPFTEAQERELEFYFEQWIRFPFDNQVIAQRAAASVTTYGESLFRQIGRNGKSNSHWSWVIEAFLRSLLHMESKDLIGKHLTIQHPR